MREAPEKSASSPLGAISADKNALPGPLATGEDLIEIITQVVTSVVNQEYLNGLFKSLFNSADLLNKNDVNPVGASTAEKRGQTKRREAEPPDTDPPEPMITLGYYHNFKAREKDYNRIVEIYGIEKVTKFVEQFDKSVEGGKYKPVKNGNHCAIVESWITRADDNEAARGAGKGAGAGSKPWQAGSKRGAGTADNRRKIDFEDFKRREREYVESLVRESDAKAGRPANS